MSEMVGNINQGFLKAKMTSSKCLVLSTTQKYSVYRHRGGNKPEDITFNKLETENFESNQLSDCQTS